VGKVFLSFVSALVLATSAHATLLSRLDGKAYYDTVLDITWLADANLAKTSGYHVDGFMDWYGAVTWADQLVYEGYDNWRLASWRKTSDSSATPCIGFNCDDSELSYMYYNHLNGDGSSRTSRFGPQDPFINIVHQYWSGMTADADHSSNYHFSDGLQFTHPNSDEFAAWAVMDGDVTSVPVPASLLLFISGLFGILGLSKKPFV